MFLGCVYCQGSGIVMPKGGPWVHPSRKAFASCARCSKSCRCASTRKLGEVLLQQKLRQCWYWSLIGQTRHLTKANSTTLNPKTLKHLKPYYSKWLKIYRHDPRDQGTKLFNSKNRPKPLTTTGAPCPVALHNSGPQKTTRIAKHDSYTAVVLMVTLVPLE